MAAEFEVSYTPKKPLDTSEPLWSVNNTDGLPSEQTTSVLKVTSIDSKDKTDCISDANENDTIQEKKEAKTQKEKQLAASDSSQEVIDSTTEKPVRIGIDTSESTILLVSPILEKLINGNKAEQLPNKSLEGTDKNVKKSNFEVRKADVSQGGISTDCKDIPNEERMKLKRRPDACDDENGDDASKIKEDCGESKKKTDVNDAIIESDVNTKAAIDKTTLPSLSEDHPEESNSVEVSRGIHRPAQITEETTSIDCDAVAAANNEDEKDDLRKEDSKKQADSIHDDLDIMKARPSIVPSRATPTPFVFPKKPQRSPIPEEYQLVPLKDTPNAMISSSEDHTTKLIDVTRIKKNDVDPDNTNDDLGTPTLSCSNFDANESSSENVPSGTVLSPDESVSLPDDKTAVPTLPKADLVKKSNFEKETAETDNTTAPCMVTSSTAEKSSHFGSPPNSKNDESVLKTNSKPSGTVKVKIDVKKSKEWTPDNIMRSLGGNPARMALLRQMQITNQMKMESHPQDTLKTEDILDSCHEANVKNKPTTSKNDISGDLLNSDDNTNVKGISEAEDSNINDTGFTEEPAATVSEPESATLDLMNGSEDWIEDPTKQFDEDNQHAESVNQDKEDIFGTPKSDVMEGDGQQYQLMEESVHDQVTSDTTTYDTEPYAYDDNLFQSEQDHHGREEEYNVVDTKQNVEQEESVSKASEIVAPPYNAEAAVEDVIFDEGFESPEKSQRHTTPEEQGLPE